MSDTAESYLFQTQQIIWSLGCHRKSCRWVLFLYVPRVTKCWLIEI